MKTKSLLRRAAAAAVCLLLGAVCLSQPALAYEDIPNVSEQRCTLRLDYLHPDVLFDFYRVAVVSEDVQFTPVRDFADYPVHYTGLDQKGWKNLASTLAAYAEYDRLRPLYSLTTDSEGKLEQDGLPAGLYLVIGHRYAIQEEGKTVYYQPMPFLICLPNWVTDSGDASGSGGHWASDVTVKPKHDTSDEPFVFRRALKSWKDAGNESQRPEGIRVQLLKDGVPEGEPVTLNRENQWFYDWNNLDNRYDWQVVEVPDEGNRDYTVSISRDSVTFVVENTYNSGGGEDPGNDPDDPPDPPRPPRPPVDPDPDNPKPPVDPDPSGPDTPDLPNVPPTEIDDPDVPLVWPPDGKDPGEELLPPDNDPDAPPELWEIGDEDVPLAYLPQTGQLWWPVPILALAGLVIFVIGWARNRRARADEE